MKREKLSLVWKQSLVHFEKTLDFVRRDNNLFNFILVHIPNNEKFKSKKSRLIIEQIHQKATSVY